mgnify:CR=1 FL=1
MYIVETKVNGNPAYAVCTVVEETLYYKVKCNDCGAELPETTKTVAEYSFCQ